MNMKLDWKDWKHLCSKEYQNHFYSDMIHKFKKSIGESNF